MIQIFLARKLRNWRKLFCNVSFRVKISNQPENALYNHFTWKFTRLALPSNACELIRPDSNSKKKHAPVVLRMCGPFNVWEVGKGLRVLEVQIEVSNVDFFNLHNLIWCLGLFWTSVFNYNLSQNLTFLYLKLFDQYENVDIKWESFAK